MPFQEEHTFPANPPQIRISLFGLLLLTPDNNHCSIGVIKGVSDHHVSIQCWERRSDGNNQPVFNLTGLPGQFSIAIDPPTTQIVKKYQPTGPHTSGDLRDFRWAVSFSDIHPQSIAVPFGMRPDILLSDGLLYSLFTTDPLKLQVDLVDADHNHTPMDRIACGIGVNIYLQADQKLKLNWPGASQPVNLPLDGHPGPYEIQITHTPPVMVGKTAHSDFREYYRVVKNVLENDKYNLIFSAVDGKLRPEANIDAPCMPGNHGG